VGILDEGLKKGEMPAMEPVKNANGEPGIRELNFFEGVSVDHCGRCESGYKGWSGKSIIVSFNL
jgi:hypothetical protein